MRPCFTESCHGGSLRGFSLGVAGLAAIILSFLYIVRKQWVRGAFFKLEEWLYFHVVIGTVALFMIVAHSGFHLRNEVAALALLFLALTVLSGVLGLAIFHYFPRKQARHEASVLMPDDLCKRLTRLHEEISETCSEKGGVFLDIYNELVIPLYRTEVGTQPPSADVSPWADRMPEGEEETFIHMAVKVEMVHDILALLGRNLRFRWALRAWLLVHVPATIGLIVFSMVHVISMFWFGVR